MLPIFNRRRIYLSLNHGTIIYEIWRENRSNTPIQGTAADIIKLAMIRVHDELKSRQLKSRLILQVHDELIVETLNSELEEVIDLIRYQMENVVDLAVPLVVDIGIGTNWYDAK